MTNEEIYQWLEKEFAAEVKRSELVVTFEPSPIGILPSFPPKNRKVYLNGERVHPKLERIILRRLDEEMGI